MPRALCTYVTQGVRGNKLFVVPGATAHIYEEGTTTHITATAYDASSGGSILSNPLTSSSRGVVQFWLDVPQTVTIAWTAPGWGGVTETIQVGSPAGIPGAHNHVASEITSGTLPLARVQEVLGLTDLSDVLVSSPAASHELYYDAVNSRFFNVLHKRRADGYRGIIGDGVTDDSTAIATALNEINVAGKGWFEFAPFKSYRAKNIPIYTKSIIDMQGCQITLPNSAGSGADIFRTLNYDTLLGGNTTGGPVNFRLMLNGAELHGNRANNASGRHAIAVYGVGSIEGPGFIHDCHGQAINAEWSSTASQLSALSLGLGDQTFKIDGITAYDCDMATALTGLDYTVVGGISGVTNTTNPTITTSSANGPHLLRAGQTITISGVVGSTGVNGTWTVTTVPTANTFTITTAAPGPYTSGGSITTPRKAAIAVKNIDSPWLTGLEVYQTLSVVPGSFGIVVASSGAVCERLHIYQNFAGALDVCNGNNFNGVNLYTGGHDQAILVRQNNVIMNTWYVDGSFNNSIGLDYQSVGGGCILTGGRINGLTSGSVCVRVWNVSMVEMRAQCIGDGGSNTSTMYVAPNSTGGVPNSAQGWYGTLRNGGNGLNASPATLTVA